MKIAGCILAGGRSSRFGTDKALIMWKGQTLLAHAIARLRPQVDCLVINSNSDGQEYREYGHALVRDQTSGYEGPLAGVLAGLRWAKDNGAELLVTAAVDTPLFPENLVAAFLKHGGEKIVAAESRSGLHPTFTLWPVSTETALASWLASGQSRKMTDFVKSQSFETEMFTASDPLDPFFNINTPEDLAMLAAS
jgi:molybdenum cofactor guanylyltransferase